MAWRHEVLEHTGPVCLIERHNLRTGSVHWEVWRLIWEVDKRYPGGRFVAGHWRPPGDEEWGEHEWTYTTVTDAREKYRVLAQPEAQRGGSPAAERKTA